MKSWLGKYAAITLCSAIGLFLFQTVCWSGLDSAAWASWVQAIGSIAAIVAAFLIANRQHLAERRLDLDRATADERRRFQVVRAILARTNAIAAGIVSEIDESPFGLADKAYSIVLDDCAKSFQELPLFELPHEELVLYCTSLPFAIRRIRKRLDADHMYLATVGPRRGNEQAELRNDLGELLTLTSDAGLFCHAEIEQRRVSP